MDHPTIGDRISGALIYAALAVILVLVLYPLIYVLSASVSEPSAVIEGRMWLFPVDLTFTGYNKIFHNEEVLIGYRNTILYTVVGTAINLFMTTAAAYPLSRKDFAGRGVITAILVFTMFFSGGLIPTYLLIKSLHMINTIWALILPGAVSVYNIIIMRTFFQMSIPPELQEAAAIDGCGNLQTLWRIVLPLSMPILAVMVLFYSVGHWNSYFNALIYLSERSKFPLQLFLREILVKGEVDNMVQGGAAMIGQDQQILDAEIIKYAMVVVANVPIFLLYPFLQKYFVKGIMIGAIKG
ncbi:MULTISPECIES: carbohydrate ABC transporter permease [Paenibacillus]|uniref:Sugar ABC transporter permease n=1 Tax=Paenibacillus cineris TaxID=237530 RepID=A0ABQ4LNP5_9BACL|nr:MULTISPECIES: carbohydrate ABC transporter permease [Paenibacillus]OXL87248.1 sugar ABC transporter permease [Paenibacillus sp. SSG-1]GIO58129.1 sugar ABC transporter permease [Paenibacillus cineris]